MAKENPIYQGARQLAVPTGGLVYSRIIIYDLADQIYFSTPKNVWSTVELGEPLLDIGPRVESVTICGQVYECDSNTRFDIVAETGFDSENWSDTGSVSDKYSAEAPQKGVAYVDDAYVPTAGEFNRHLRFRMLVKSETNLTFTHLRCSLAAIIKTCGM